MKAIIVFALLLVCSLFFSQANAGAACIACGGTISPYNAGATQPPISATYTLPVKYMPGFENNFGDGTSQCYWCQASNGVSFTQGQPCTGLPVSFTSACNGTGACIVTYASTYLMASLPNSGNKAACNALASAWFYYNITDINNLKCGCYPTGAGTRGDAEEAKSFRDEEFELIREKDQKPVEKDEGQIVNIGDRQITVDCTHSLLCDARNGRTDCSNCTNCPSSTTIPITSIAYSNQSCPGYYASPWGSNSCPMKAGGNCAICNNPDKTHYGGAIFSQTGSCPQDNLCLQCHVMTLTNGNTICGAHLTTAQSSCFCAPQMAFSGNPNCSTALRGGWGYAPRQSSTTSTVGSGGGSSPSSGTSTGPAAGGPIPSAPPGSPTSGTTQGLVDGYTTVESQWMCAPWGEDQITMQCVSGTGSTCGVASVSDCLAGRAVLPTACSGTYHCGGHICGKISNSAYTSYPTFPQTYYP